MPAARNGGFSTAGTITLSHYHHHHHLPVVVVAHSLTLSQCVENSFMLEVWTQHTLFVMMCMCMISVVVLGAALLYLW